MKHRFIITLIMLVAIATGCSKSYTTDPSTPEGYTPSTSPIAFQAPYNWGDAEHSPKQQNSVATRGFETNTNNFDDFGVLAYYMKSDEDISTTTPNFMYNEEVTKNGNEPWSYSPIKFWPNNENDKIQFFAYHPYNSTSVTLSGNSAQGTPEFTVTPDQRPFNQVDVITASTAPLKKGDEISLAFSHKLAQARLYAAHCGGVGAVVKVVNIEVKGFRSTGKLIYNENAPSDDVDKMIWEHQQGKDETLPGDLEKESYLFLRSTGKTDNELREEETIKRLTESTNEKSNYTLLGENGEAYLMLVPQKEIGEVVIDLYFSYELNGSTVQSNELFVIPAGTTTLEENKIMNYLLLIDPTGIGFGTINITSKPWDDTTIGKDFEIE